MKQVADEVKSLLFALRNCYNHKSIGAWTRFCFLLAQIKFVSDLCCTKKLYITVTSIFNTLGCYETFNVTAVSITGVK